MDKKHRSEEEDFEMVHMAHASRYHWGQIGRPINLQRGEWQISRVYADLKKGASCLDHAQRCLAITLEHNISDFDKAFAYEAMARAYAILRQKSEKEKYLKLAKKAGEKIAKKEDKEYFLSELATVE